MLSTFLICCNNIQTHFKLDFLKRLNATHVYVRGSEEIKLMINVYANITISAMYDASSTFHILFKTMDLANMHKT